MKDRLVFWGKENESRKVLITIDLNEDSGMYDVQVIEAEQVTEEFDNLVRNEWRNNGGDIVFPEVLKQFSRELSLTQDLLPREIKVDRDDLLKMAQAEWNFFVLSKRLKNTYSDELEEFEQKVSQMEEYDQTLWNNMKGFWSKVQKQIRERNLAKRHGNDLKRRTNAIFSSLKTLRSRSEKDFVEASAIHKAKFMNQLEAIKERMKEGKSLRHLFDDLKKIQKEFKNYRFTRQDHSAVWDQLDGLFKEIKARKYGKSNSENDPLVKTTNRVDGLKAAIARMKKSISKDQKELKFQKDKIAQADGQLEAQIRQAKLSMLEERIHSKEIKLEDMFKTEKQLTSRLSSLKEKARREEEEQKVKERIAKEIQEKQAKLEHDPKVQAAAAQISEKPTDPSAFAPSVEMASIVRAAVDSSHSSLYSEEE